MSILNQLREGCFTIGVLHVPPFPTSVLGGERSLEEIVEHCVKNARVLEESGFSSVLLQNVGDEPVGRTASPDTVANMAVLAREVKKALSIPLGVTLLDHDGKAPLAIAKAAGADYVRIKVFCGLMVKMTGMLEGLYYDAVRYRREIGAGEVDILADVFDREGYPLGDTDLGEMARFAVQSCKADGLILTGKDQRGTEEMLETAGRATGVPLLIGGGVDAQNAGQLKGRAQGFIIGSCLKTPGGPYADLSPRACREVAEAFAKQ
ncbi:BtpA/SgcQ family protein [bacterium 210820-DFI.6.52]|nr:BtpA/SgcQ family protein [bacterium 210820-DFI.6.52]